MRFARLIPIVCFVFLILGGSIIAKGQTPEWIWSSGSDAPPSTNEVRFFRKSFEIPGRVEKAELTIMADDEGAFYLNGKLLGQGLAWIGTGFKAQRYNVTEDLKLGSNVLAVRAVNSSVSAGMIAKLEVNLANQPKMVLVSDTTWLSSGKEKPGWQLPEFVPRDWKNAFSVGRHGMQPWGNIMDTHRATPASDLSVPPGFKAELVRSAEAGEGSWVCLTVDDKGRLIISPQEVDSSREGGLLRLTLTDTGTLQKIERIHLPVGAAMGLLYAFDSLYVSGQGANGLGLYRLRDTDQDDQFDRAEFLNGFPGGKGEHGAHAIVLGPDKMLYLIHGNSTGLPARQIASESPYKNYAEDDLLPRLRDPVATFFDDIKIPYGYVLRTDADGKKWELICGGLRNTYDFDFNADGEMIAFDSDMEWDVGLPWYRPTRVLHLVSGGEYGFREGSSKWPSYYSDSLPSAVDVGLSSPTGVKFGTRSHFPSKYQKAFFTLDWSYGRILAVHLKPSGATYTANFENFVSGRPLPVTDLEFGRDGAMYFLIGGRGTQSGLYRVSYVGSRTGEPPPTREERAENAVAAESRALRRKLEMFHHRKDPAAINALWPSLNSDDRWIRFAARVALENQDVALWKTRALAESRTNAALTALLGLARCGSEDTQRELLDALVKFPSDRLNDAQNLDKLRVLMVSFARQGRPSGDQLLAVTQTLGRQFPAATEPLNRELARLLVYLDAPDVIVKTLALLQAAPRQEEQVHYAFVLHSVKKGWSLEQRRQYFGFLNRAIAEYRGGNSFTKYLDVIRKQAIATLDDNERTELAHFIEPNSKPEPVVQSSRRFVNDWKMDDLTPLLDQVGKQRSFPRGQAAFREGQCLACHKFGNQGGSVGPDITAAASRFNRRDLLETIIAPSKVVSDQYLSTTILKRDTTETTGLVLEEDSQKIVLLINPLTQQRTEILKSDIEQRGASRISPMPEGLLNAFTKEEILDLLAYIESGGNPNHSAFTTK